MSETINLKKLKDPFPASDIEWRVAQCGERDGKIWAKVLAYVTSRAIQERLDEVVGPENWETKYEFKTGNELTAGVICRLAIRCGPDRTWVTKEDGAEQTDIESFKGGISSALKRAGSAWGIGRYLYNLEEGFADIHPKRINGAIWGQTKEKKGFFWTPPSLPAWALPEGHAQTTATQGHPPVTDNKGSDAAKQKAADEAKAKKPVTEGQLKRMFAITKGRAAAGWTPDNVHEVALVMFKVESTAELNMSQYDKLIGWIEKSTYAEIAAKAAEWMKSHNGPTQGAHA